MSHNSNITEALRRPIQNGSSFSAFIKETNCKVFSYGNGNNSTTEGVEYMVDLIQKSSYQVKKLAEKLKKSTLQATISTVHNFLTTYIQYSADAELQRLRSPGCSWSVRKTGIDCKSFSIFAGALLREMGISFVIRQVKQPSFYPEQYTHVYVVVPTNQKITSANAMTSYYNLDGTVLDNVEVAYSAKKDKLMNGLPYQGMMSPSVSARNIETKESKNFERSFSQFEKVGFSKSDLNAMKEYMKQLQLSSNDRVFIAPTPRGILFHNIKKGQKFVPSKLGVWQEYYKTNRSSQGLGIDPMTVMMAVSAVGAVGGEGGEGGEGGSGSMDISQLFGSDIMESIGSIFGANRAWYKPEMITRDGETLINIVEDKKGAINQALSSKNLSALARAVADFKATLILIDKTVKAKRAEGWNDPTMQSLGVLIKGTETAKSNSIGKLNSWLSTNFNQNGSSGSLIKKSSEIEVFADPSPVYVRPEITHTEQIPSLSLKQGLSSVRSFDLVGSGQIILQSMQVSQPPSTTTGGGYYPTQGDNYNTGGQTENFESGVQTASLIPGFSNTALIATGGIIVAGVLLYPTIKKQLIKK